MPTDTTGWGLSMTVYYVYHCPHCVHEHFGAYDEEYLAMNDGLQHYHSTGHEIGEIHHFDGAGQVDGELYEGAPTHGQHVHTQHVNHSQGHHEHGHHEHGHHEHGHHEHGHHEHGHHQEPHIF